MVGKAAGLNSLEDKVLTHTYTHKVQYVKVKEMSFILHHETKATGKPNP